MAIPLYQHSLRKTTYSAGKAPLLEATTQSLKEQSISFPSRFPTIAHLSLPRSNSRPSVFIHPNVDLYGNICSDILQDKWSSAYDVRTILLYIQSLLGVFVRLCSMAPLFLLLGLLPLALAGHDYGQALTKSILFFDAQRFGYLQRPEDMTTSRQAYKINPNNPGSDLAGETAAPMAAALFPAGYTYGFG
ncbi:unnamed protein product [Camellia sinensis]